MSTEDTPKPVAWMSNDGIKVIADDELEAWINAGDGQIMDDYPFPLFDQATLDAAVAKERERCAKLCDELRHEAMRALVAWDGTVLPKAHDGLMQERMEDLRAALAGLGA